MAFDRGDSTAGTSVPIPVSTTVGTNLVTLPNPSAVTYLQVNADNTVSALSAASFRSAIGAGTGTITSVTGSSPVSSSGGTTPSISLSSGYGDTQNPYGSKTANYVLAAPNGSSGVPTFRALVAEDITGTIAVANGGTGASTASNARVNLLPSYTGNGTKVLALNSGATDVEWVTSGGSMVYPGAGIAVSTGTAWATSKTSPSGTIVGTTDTQTLTNKTLTDPAIIGTILEDVFTITDAAAFEIDPGNGSVQLITLGASRTPKATNFAAGEAVTMMILDGTAYTITWTDSTFGTGGVVWVGGTAPTLDTTKYTVIELWKVGTQVYGALVGAA